MVKKEIGMRCRTPARERETETDSVPPSEDFGR